ncbi:hypothetical protein NIES4071_82210 [Calothrix sp. NIES-4071]|nr:hypothetical protein NIES4071_82210 [Calothrix sp. NIES-4071]BAZ62490.1 hypothetical protein NIES4105_82140 [Calothrix sp. NIES-4105]
MGLLLTTYVYSIPIISAKYKVLSAEYFYSHSALSTQHL